MGQERLLPSVSVWSVARVCAAAVGIAALIFILYFVANLESLGRGGQNRITDAFASGALGQENFRRGDAVNGYHQYNDCLILSMAVSQQAPRRLLAISPMAPANNAEMCTSFGRHDPRFFYHNYLHGQVALVRYLLPFLSIEQIRTLYRLLTSLLLCGGIAVSLMRLARGDRRRENGVALIIMLAFARAFGLEVFGQSLGHGPADFVLISFAAFFALSRETSDRTMILAAAVFGTLTMIFEMLTGGLPLGIAVTFGLLCFRGVRTAVLATTSFSVAAVATYAIKLAAVAVVFGNLSFLREAETRTVGVLPSDAVTGSLLHAIFGNTEAMMPGLGPMAGVILLLSVGFGTWSVIKRPTPEIQLLALSNAPIFLWPIIFRQHMIIHGWFMDRIFVWTIASGFSMLFLALGRQGPIHCQTSDLQADSVQ